MLTRRRKQVLGLLLTVGLVLVLGLVISPFAGDPEKPVKAAGTGATRYVSTTGSDTAAGTATAPWKTIKTALTKLRPGDTLEVAAGVYDQGKVDPTLTAGTSTAPITVHGAEGARIVGLVRMSNASYWTWDNVDVTWKTGTASTEHMVRWTGGTGWQIVYSEFYGAHSYAALHITGNPTNWLVSGNYIHDTYKSNSTNQDHLIYFSTGTGGGIIERNILAHSPNGRAVKIGSAATAKTDNVVIRYNTMVDNLGPSNVQVSYYSSNNQVYRNLMSGSSAQNVTSFNLNGTGNVAHDNLGWGSSAVVDTSDTGLKDTGGNVHIDPQLDATYHPANATAANYGRYAPGASASPAPTPAPAVASASTAVAAPFLGIYNGGPTTDDAAKASFGTYPDTASTYYQGNQRLSVTAENARQAKGITPWLTITSKGGPYTLAQIGSGAGDSWIDAIASDAAAIGGPLYLTLDHEFEVKLNQNQFGTSPPTIADYQKALNRFCSRVNAAAPAVMCGYWFGGFDKTKIEAVGSGLVGMEFLAADLYSTKSHPASETFEQTVTPTLTWIKQRSWYHAQPVMLGEFGDDKAHGDASVAAYMTNLRPRLAKLGLAGALLFNRDKTDADGRVVGYKIDSGTTPQARAAFAASLTNR